ncbi:UPF0481 protein [Actinidia chinensis var. chinensis]|uniref:UPF0481 protein n=1 Tax=Actinidia chinensis var. chinensis TaxID=1590841 RepID=A0A2R6RX99_ACTCC|nr:UPF0481 protein [Actinidia chinensis var. chinensis]
MEDSLVETIHKKISEAAEKRKALQGAQLEASIYRVPDELRKLKTSAYRPRLVSIGPFHSKHQKSSCQELKASYADSLLSRVSGSEEQAYELLKECVEEMERAVDKAKKCYSEQVDELNPEMLFIDGCFVLEFLYNDYQIKHLLAQGTTGSIHEANQIRKEDNIFCSALARLIVQHDLLLLENQLPFFILEKLFHLTVERVPDHPPSRTLKEYVILSFGDSIDPKRKAKFEKSCTCSPRECVLCLTSFCRPMPRMYIGNKGMELENSPIAEENYHVLHILHDYYLPLEKVEDSGESSKKESDLSELMHSASDLDYAGVKFVPIKDGFTVSFSRSQGQFEIPIIRIDDFTEPLLRNLIAFEQCCPRVSSHFTSFAYLMDSLISTEKDVKVLERAGVIHNYLGTDENASDLFNKLCHEVALVEFKFVETCRHADEYSKRCWPAAVAYVRRQYFATLWTTIAFLVAFIAFGITVTNFVRSFL